MISPSVLSVSPRVWVHPVRYIKLVPFVDVVCVARSLAMQGLLGSIPMYTHRGRIPSGRIAPFGTELLPKMDDW